MIRKWILRLLFGEDSESWKEMFRIAVDCNDSCKRILKREAYMIGRYGAIVDRENQILDAIKNSSDLQLKMRVLEIINENSED